MEQYRVVQVTEVAADDAEDAVRRRREGEGTVTSSWARPVALPTDRYRSVYDYTQERDILDLAWDRFMDLSLPQGSASDYPGGLRLAPHVLKNLGMHEVSILFDMAITAFREGTVGPDNYLPEGPEDEGPPVQLAIGQVRYDLEWQIVRVVERFNEILSGAWGIARPGQETSIADRIAWAQDNTLLTAEDIDAWRAALVIRTQILAEDQHTQKLSTLRLCAQVATASCERVAERVKTFQAWATDAPDS